MTLFTFYRHNLNAERLILFELFAEAEDINVHRQVQGRPEGLGGGPGQKYIYIYSDKLWLQWMVFDFFF